LLPASAQAPIDSLPINVREECLDVLRPVRRLVIENERVLPNVHHEHWVESGDVARLMQREPVIRQIAVGWILVADGPTHSAHLADAYKLGFPNVVAAEALLRRFAKSGTAIRITGAAATFQIIEVVFVQNHAVVFEAESSIEFRVFRELVLNNFSAFDEFGNFFVQLVGLFHVTFVEFEVHFQRFIRDSLQVAEIELSSFVSNSLFHSSLLRMRTACKVMRTSANIVGSIVCLMCGEAMERMSQ